MRSCNTARTVSEIAPQVSLFVPLAVPSTNKLPTYVSMDSQSYWHVSALLSTAIESMTLPSRLTAQNKSLQRLDQFENALNINGSQNIAKLRMSIDHRVKTNGNFEPRNLTVRAKSRDSRLPSQERGTGSVQPSSADGLDVFDIDFFAADDMESSHSRETSEKIHVFGQAESFRGHDEPEYGAAEKEDAGLLRARQRAAGLSLVHR